MDLILKVQNPMFRHGVLFSVALCQKCKILCHSLMTLTCWLSWITRMYIYSVYCVCCCHHSVAI